MVNNPRLIGMWARISAPKAVSYWRLRHFHFPLFSTLRFAQGLKVQGFNYRSLKPAEFLVASKECRTSKYSYFQALLVKYAIDTW